MPKHIERAFEDAIEHYLVGHDWLKGNAGHFDRERALDAGQAITFIRDTQPEIWANLTTQHGASIEKAVIDWLAKALDTQGTLDVLRQGF